MAPGCPVHSTVAGAYAPGRGGYAAYTAARVASRCTLATGPRFRYVRRIYEANVFTLAGSY